MSDITGPPAPKELQPSVRGADKASQVAKDPSNTDARTQNQQHSDTGSGESSANRSRDPAVSISATAAKVQVGQQLNTTVSSVDSEGRPIIVTDKATFALKPDAGLQIEDDIVLKVTEADKAIIAELLERNSYPLHPPVRVELIVTEIHGPQNQPVASPNSAKEVVTNQTYRAPLTAQIKTDTIIPGTPTVRPEVTGLTPSTDAKQSSLINQSGGTPVQPATSALSQINERAFSEQTTAKANTGSIQPSVSQGIQQSTQPITNPNVTAATGPGIGPAVTAISTTGQATVIQVLDPSISKVSPTEIATVKQVSPLTAAHAVALDTAGGKLLSTFDTMAALSVVETSRGSYIADSKDVNQLTGELIRITSGNISINNTAQLNAPNQAQNTSPTFPALLIALEDGALPQKVSVSFAQTDAAKDTATRTQTATINTVTTQAAFLSPAGPKTDIRLQTTAGDVSLTIPSAARPVVGDSIQIHWPEPKLAAASTPSITPLAQENAPIAEASATQVASAATNASILANWPAMQESITAIAASGNTAATFALQDKTAQGGGKLTNSLLFFIAAAGRAGPRAWIGNDVQQNLQNNAPSLLRQLSSDISQMATMTNDRSGEWRAFMLPLEARNENVPLAALLVQQHPEINPDDGRNNDNNSQKEEPDNQRFILQVQFSVLGDIQLDGQINKKQFDLTVRSASAFNTVLQNDLKGLFDAALAANGYAGLLRFEEQYPFSIDAETIIETKLMSAAQQ